MSSNKPSKKTTTRTIRIDEEYDDILKLEADRRGISVNALMDQILKRYVEAQRYFDNQTAIVLSDSTLLELIGFLNTEMLSIAGTHSGIDRPKDRLLMRGLPLNYESVIWFISQVLGEYNGWFRSDYHLGKDKVQIHLRHRLGMKWSTFLQSYIEGMFFELFDIKPEFQVLDHSVTISINRKIIEKL
jgi:hypothetical protein